VEERWFAVNVFPVRSVSNYSRIRLFSMKKFRPALAARKDRENAVKTEIQFPL
jgi:hypothetical protein